MLIARAVAREDRRACRTVLVVDADDACRRSVIKLLTRARYVTVDAASAVNALDFFHHNRTLVACVVIDLVMPGTDGKTLFRALRDRAPHLPMLLTTGMPPGVDGYDALLDQRSELLLKPFSATDLVDAVDRLAMQGPT